MKNKQVQSEHTLIKGLGERTAHVLLLAADWPRCQVSVRESVSPSVMHFAVIVLLGRVTEAPVSGAELEDFE